MLQPMLRHKVATGAMLAIIAMACVLYLGSLGERPLQDYDEALYAIATHEMVTTGDLATITFRGQPYFEKPPLYFWLATISEKIFGENEFALRLPSALAGIGLVLLVMLLTRELSGSRWAGVLAGAIELTMAPVLVVARDVRLDTLVTFFIVLAAYAFVRALKNPKWFLLFGFAAGLAVLAKSVIALFAFVAAAAFAYWLLEGSVGNRFSFLKQKQFSPSLENGVVPSGASNVPDNIEKGSHSNNHSKYEKWHKAATPFFSAGFWWGIGVFLLVVLPWHIYEIVRFGSAFVQTYVGFNVVERTTHDLLSLGETNFDYVWYLANFGMPWMQALVAATLGMAVFWRQIHSQLRNAAAACLTVVASVIIVCFATATKSSTYLLPLYPFAAVAIALIAFPVLRAWTKTVLGSFGAGLAVCLLLVLGLYGAVYNGFHINPYFALTDELAREEKDVGEILAEKGMNRTLYAYGDPALGSIMYYSHNTQSIALLPDDDQPEPGSFIVLPSGEHQSLSDNFRVASTDAVYLGQHIELLEVLSED